VFLLDEVATRNKGMQASSPEFCSYVEKTAVDEWFLLTLSDCCVIKLCPRLCVTISMMMLNACISQNAQESDFRILCDAAILTFFIQRKQLL